MSRTGTRHFEAPVLLRPAANSVPVAQQLNLWPVHGGIGFRTGDTLTSSGAELADNVSANWATGAAAIELV